MDFTRRSEEAEWMDTESISLEEFDDCLRDLRIINRCTLAYRPTLRWLDSMLRGNAGPVTIMDIGCGGGDMLRQIAAWAKKRKITVTLTGIDINPWSKQSAESQ